MQYHPEKDERLWHRTGTPRNDIDFLPGLESVSNIGEGEVSALLEGFN
jgi:hypothetical protein